MAAGHGQCHQFDFDAAFINSSAMVPIPVKQTRTTQHRTPPGPQRRSSCQSRSARRPFRHSSKTSSGNQPSRPRSSHDTSTSLQTDGPAAADSVASPNPLTRAASAGAGPPLSSLLRDMHALNMNAHAASAESVSSAGGATTASLSARTTMTSDPSPSASGEASRPFVLRSGRTYLNDATLPYPLPSDLTELHRQSLRTLLLIQLFSAPVCSPSLTTNPPRRVLEIGCGSGFWSIMCHRYYKGRGHGAISFTGIDLAPLCPGSVKTAADDTKPDRDMKWTFVKHDLRHIPWPLPSEEFDLVMVKDMSLAMTSRKLQFFIEEYLRLLRPGGTLEIWESDHLIRMLRPHVPDLAQAGDADEHEAVASLGAYVMLANTPLSAPLNPFLVEYNHWLTRALEARDLSAVPCTLIGPVLLQESGNLVDLGSRRLAVPLSDVRWEREGVGAVVTGDSQSTAEAKGKKARPTKTEQRRTLTAGQDALRTTALLTVVQQVQALEPILREASGKSQDEWDVWLGKMMSDLMGESGTSWGECLEVGAWWAKKKVKEGTDE